MLLSMRDINKDYIQGKNTVKVLNEVCLDVEEGEYLAIMGPSGSGKTTLMNIIGYLDVPTSGNYSFDGEEFSGAKDNKLAEVRNEKIGFVFQKYYLLPKLTARDNVALPLLYRGIPKKERNKMAAEALKMVGLEDRIDFYPNQLSGGQCQRVSIARAIAGNPKLILADEPTGALDTNSGNQIMEIFRDLNEKGSTIIMITHESEIAKKANKIKHILDGKIIDDSRKDGASNE